MQRHAGGLHRSNDLKQAIFQSALTRNRKFRNLTAVKDIGNRFSHNPYATNPTERYLDNIITTGSHRV
jgi:hypothetical protein